MFKKRNTTYSANPTRASKQAHKQAKKIYPTYDTSLINPKPSKKPLVLVIIILAIIAIAVAIFIVATMSGCSCAKAAGQEVEVTIEKGATAGDVADTMQSSGLIGSAFTFKNCVSSKDASSQLKPGTYIFPTGLSDEEYVDMLIEGPSSTSQKLSLYEGIRLKEVASKVDSATNGRIKESEFINATNNASKWASDYSFLKGAGTNSLEGFLYPDTYNINGSMDVEDIVRAMLDNFKSKITGLNYSYPSSQGLSEYDTLILASIVEKESTASVKTKVASVFYNRLSSGMYLNSDATTAYEVGHDPTSDEVHADTPYSTYTNLGLPPTPICNPSIDTIRAVCNPDDTDYLYFYFKNDSNGQVQYKFSKTFEEHQDAILNM